MSRDKKVNFSSRYTKLDLPLFPTIRGKSWYNKTPMKEFYFITVHYKFYCRARLFCKKRFRIEEIPLDFLQYDAHPEPVDDHEHFAVMINQFRTGFMPKATPESEMTVLIFQRVCKNCGADLDRISKNFLAVNYCIHCWDRLVRRSEQRMKEKY